MLPTHQPDGGGDRPDIRERGLGDILGATFSIYGARFVPIIFISAVAHIPALALAFIPSESLAFSAVLAFVGGAAPAVVYAAVVAAVGQVCAFGRVSPAECFGRVAWRGVSVFALAALYGAISAGALIAAEPLAAWGAELAELAEAAESPEALETPPFPAASVLSLMALVAVSILASIYMTTIAPSVMIEGRRGLSAAARGFRLARGSEWRIFGHIIVYLMVLIGMMIAVALPFVIVGGALGGDAARAGTNPTVAIGSVAAQIIAQPVLYIAATLLYFDIRLRKEGYDAARLSEEMGAARA